MSYQVLARKWRPKTFGDMVGQAHVVKALSNALDRDQLHHAYLFTGTRGVGKTTLARILSKAFNCEQGVSSRPCGQCSACREIDEGRFVDLLEVDAASRTKVDQTRELLDNVPFSPVKGRFKVYLIDEVHMFSAHSFNALLKTLEEPPPHVKFLLATTDPQKVPVTVLSRCLQFNLKRLVPEQIAEQLSRILEAEGVALEQPALNLLARAADGSMRDGLSLLDQAIAYGGGRVTLNEVRTMLGTVDRDFCLNLMAALAELDGPAVLDELSRIADLTPDFAGLLQELIGLLHRIALFQEVPATLAADDPDRERIEDMSARVAPEDVQLFYQIALLGQQDLSLAPDPRTGIEMVLLRMLAFRPDPGDGSGAKPGHGKPVARSRIPEPDVPATPAATSKDSPAQTAGADSGPKPGEQPVARPTAQASGSTHEPCLNGPDDWHDLVQGLGLGGVASQLAQNCELAAWNGSKLVLTLDPECRNLRVPFAEERLRSALADALGEKLNLEIRISAPETETPARRRSREQEERRAQAEALMQNDPVARILREELDARWIPGSVEPTQ